MTRIFGKSLAMVCAAALVATFGCGGSSGGKAGTIKSSTVTSTGDKITSASLTVKDGKYQVTLAPIVDPTAKTPYGSGDASKISVTGSSKASSSKLVARYAASTDATSCTTDIKFGSGTASKADVAFIVDTTASMGSVVSGVSTSMATFAKSLSDAGVDAKFAFVTFGDAFDTKLASSSAYTKGTGSDDPPSFDTVERPMIDFSGLTDFNAFVDEVKTNVGSGASGVGTTENYYAAAVAMAGKSADYTGLTRRDGVPFYEIIASDACAYTEESQGDSITGKWLPPKKADLASLLGDGSVTIHGIQDDGMSCGDQISAKELADATGGVRLDLGSGDVDLTALKLADYITNFWIVTVDPKCVGDLKTFVLILVVSVDDGAATRTQTFTFTVTLA